MANRRPVVLRTDTTPARLQELPTGDVLDAETLTNALQVLLAGLVTNNSAGITDADTVLQALGKLQAQANVPTNLTLGAATANSRVLSISKGTGVTLPAATSSAAGLMTAAESVKLGTVATNASANSSDAFLLNRANHSGTQPLTTITRTGTAAATNVVGAGGIIERGSNTNGEYVRFADGTQICTRSIAGYTAGTYIVNFAAAFISVPSVCVSITPSEGWDKEIGIYGSLTQWILNMAATKNTNSLQLLAVGRWK